MTTVLVGLVLLGLAVSSFLGFRLARLSQRLEAALALAHTRRRVIRAMARVVENNEALQEQFKRIDRASNADALNELYEDVVSGDRSN